MGQFIQLSAKDGFAVPAYVAEPAGTPKGGVVVVQEIFGVNAHIREVVDGFAREGYVSIAPSLFDRVKRGVELGYSPEDVQLGRGFALQVPQEKLLADIAACINVVKHAGPVAVVGYCWGGSLAHLAACELPVRAAVDYYGTRTLENLHLKTRAPVQYHFGDRDKTLPPEAIGKIRAADPGGEFHVYAADHGFNCDHRAAFDPAAESLARQRTLDFLERHLRAPAPDSGNSN